MKENKLSVAVLEQFWSLSTQGDYKTEIFKIINEVCFYFKQEHIDYLFAQITATPADKLTMTEFDCLCEIGKYCKSADFQQKISNFFWSIVIDSDKYKNELIDNCISKFAEMIKYWSLDHKKPFFTGLVAELKDTSKAALPILELFTKLISD